MNGSIGEPVVLGAWRRVLLVALGGALGAVLRFVVTSALPEAAGEAWLAAPGLLVVNLSGALVAGFFRGLLEQEQARGMTTAVSSPRQGCMKQGAWTEAHSPHA